MVREWRRAVEGLFAGALHGHRVTALALVSFAVAAAGHCHGGRVAAAAPGPATVASRRRRVERLLANGGLDPRAAMGALAASVLAPWSGRRVVLILDETPGRGRGGLCCMRVSAGYRRRAVPLAFACYRAGRAGRPMPSVVRGLLDRVAAALPGGGGGCEVTLLADRGLCWPALVDACAARGWHYVLRMQGATRVRLPPDGAERRARDLAPRPGTSWFGERVEVFKKAGWREANVVAVWERRCREGPWLLVTDLPASYARCRGYAKRCWCEQSHRDDKSSGFRWGESRVSDPTHAARLLLVLALATLLALSLGTRVLKRGLRRQFDAGRTHRTLSLCQMGLRWLRDCITNERDLTLAVALYPP
jgi:hypothetical protein